MLLKARDRNDEITFPLFFDGSWTSSCRERLVGQKIVSLTGRQAGQIMSSGTLPLGALRVTEKADAELCCR